MIVWFLTIFKGLCIIFYGMNGDCKMYYVKCNKIVRNELGENQLVLVVSESKCDRFFNPKCG